LPAALGLPPDGTVIPHFDNMEGGTHDTRFCYMGERRLRELEALLPGNGWILGVDEHTALVVDVEAAEGVVTGRGGVTVRHRGQARRFDAGTRLPLAALAEAAHRPAGAVEGTGSAAPGGAPTGSAPPAAGRARSPLLTEVSRLERAFEGAVAGRRADEAVAGILELDRGIPA